MKFFLPNDTSARLTIDRPEPTPTEQALRKKEEYFQALIENSSDLTTILDRDGSKRYESPSVEHLLGYKPGELIGQSAFDFVHPEDLALATETFTRVSQTPGISPPIELRLRHKDGSWCVFECACNNLLSDPVVAGIVVNSRDITKRKRAEEALQQSEERFRLMVESVKDYAIFMLDPGGYIVSWNKGAQRIKGYQAHEIIGQHFSCFFSPEDIERGTPDHELKMAAAEGRYEDEVWLVRKDGTRFLAQCTLTALGDVMGHLRGFSKVTRDITARRFAEEQIRHDALYDRLTDLPNRTLFMDHLQQSIARAARHKDYLFAVLFLDLDRFKIINDSFGHVLADQLLVAIADKLRDCLRPEDTVARLGGDEFAILLDDIHDVSDATRVADRIRRELAAPFTLSGHDVFTTASIGITMSGHHYVRPEDCLRDADTAMYRAKAQGLASYEIFNPHMHARVVETLKLETDLRRAIEREEFCVHYQPVMSLEAEQITGFEALVRWQHPDRGLILPVEFIPLAEETGLIIPLGQWVLGEACRQLRVWQERLGALATLTISVNVSSRQFSHSDLIDQTKQMLLKTGVTAESLKLEITESAIMERTQLASATLRSLRELGVKLHIDDFGTGYSSLSYLHRLPVDALKIDRSFISQMSGEKDDQVIIEAIIQLGHRLGVDVIAEGVETAEQLAYLKELSCHYGQGYYFSGPVNSEAAGRLIMA